MLALLGFGLSFAQIKAEEVPQGIMPNKRQVVGTGVTTTSSSIETTTSATTIISTSSDSVITTTSSTPITTSEPVTITTSTPVTTDPPTTTTSIPSDTSATPGTTTSDTPVISDSSTSDGPSTTDAPSSTDSASATAIADPSSTDSASSQESSEASSEAQSSTEIPTTIAVTTTNADGSTVTSHVATSTLAPASSRQTATGVVRTMTGSASNIVVIGSSTINRSTLSSATTITSALLAEETIPSTYTSYYTSDGSVYSRLVTTNRVLTSTTGYATATLKPALQNSGGSGSNLSTSSKKIVGGVVGGIGGAVLIGGIALVAWRLWGKKKRQQVPQDDFLDSRDDSIRREKTGSQGLASPPDRYHTPGGPVNASSNF